MKQNRVDAVLANLEEMGLNQILITDPLSILYLTGRLIKPLERFYALYLNRNGNHKIFINLLETTHPRPRFIDHYSSELSVTAKHLSEVCKKVSGKTALQWITEFIENDIRYFLLHTDLSIKEIVFQLQFPNASFFGKYVRSHFGKSPSEFRRSAVNK